MARQKIDTDVCIFGAGPHGLAAAVHLRQADPDLNITVLDPSGEWLSGWNAQFARAEIEMLRSPVVHHPAPDPYALYDYINKHDLPRSGFAYDLPTRAAFSEFCQSLITDAALDAPLASAPASILSRDNALTIEARDMTISARHLVVATNPHWRKIPDWVWPLAGQHPDLVRHGSDIDLSAMATLTGQRIAIIGGGLSAAHLAIGAALRGASVQLMIRHTLNVRAFDTAPGWLGPKYLDGFEAEANPNRRLATVQRVRSGGSIPEWMHTRLKGFDGAGEIILRESVEVHTSERKPDSGCYLHLNNGDRMYVDSVWLATGTQADPHALRCLRPLLADVGDVNGFPLLDKHLRLGPHPAFIMGRSTALTLGPAAGNLWGAQRAAHRITEAITGVDLSCKTATWIDAPTRRN
ncbi:FAD/NAD(P)-binding protein [Ilumatobacter sp.]|uniref:FAD/NAD(P)-binding protein n=1 Tax=Ilumatobacter sp. TaxID=1967498 RepID=UPI003F6B3FC1|nr:FAD/NAD(P)-binding protein [Acidimicrobiales bacterium]